MKNNKNIMTFYKGMFMVMSLLLTVTFSSCDNNTKNDDETPTTDHIIRTNNIMGITEYYNVCSLIPDIHFWEISVKNDDGTVNTHQFVGDKRGITHWPSCKYCLHTDENNGKTPQTTADID